jgi:hypothetical protein
VELASAIQALVVLTTQTYGVTKMIIGLEEVEVERLAQAQDLFQTERRYQHFRPTQVIRQSVEEAAMEDLRRGLHQLPQVI